MHFYLRRRACGYCRGRFGRQSQMAEDLLNHCFLRYKANNFHYLAAAGAFERHDLKDASHQKCPHYRGFTIRFTVRPAILLFLFEVERGVDAGCVASFFGVDFTAVGGCGWGGLVGLIRLIDFGCSHTELFAQPHLFGGTVETDGQGGGWTGTSGHQGAPSAVWCKNSGIGVAMAAWRRDQGGQPV